MKGVKNYLKNLTKSTAYLATDIAKKDLVPNVSEFTETNSEFLKTTYNNIRHPKATAQKVINDITDSKLYEAVEYGAKNLFEDLKTGNFYNKERDDRDANKLAGFDADDFNDLSEFDIDDDDNSSSNNDDVTAGDIKIVEAVESSNKAMASTTANAVIASANMTAKNQRVSTGILYNQNKQLFGAMHNDISILNATMDTMLKMQTATFQNIDHNMSDYFTQTLKLHQESNAMLKELLEMQRNQYKSAQERDNELNKKKKRGRRYSDVSSGGIPDLQEYFDNLKDNVNKQFKSLGLPELNEDGNMLAAFMTSPLKMVLEPLASNLIPNIVKEASQELDKSISGLFGHFIARLSNAVQDDEDGIFGKLGKLLGVRTSVNNKIDPGKYHKGPVPFDGITRKAITEVIPSYLRRIEAAVSGRSEKMFDYDSGKWIDPRDIKKEYENIHKNAVRQGTSDLRASMDKYVKDHVKSGKGLEGVDSQEELAKAMDQFQEYLTDRHGIFNPAQSMEKNKVDQKYPLVRKYYDILRVMYTTFDLDVSRGKGKHTKLSTRINLANNILAARDQEERTYRQLEQQGLNKFTQYFAEDGKFNEHGTFKGKNKDRFVADKMGILSTVDDKGNNIFDYLQNVSKELAWQREYYSSVGVVGGIGGGAIAGPSKALPNIKDIKINKIKKNKEDAKNVNKDETVLKEGIKAIVEGKTVNFMELGVSDEQDAKILGDLAYIVQNAATEDIVKMRNALRDESTVGKIINKKYSTDKDAKDLDKIIKESSNYKDDEEKDKQGAFDKLFGKAKKAKEYFSSIVTAPGEIFADVLYSADRAIYNMLFKNTLKGEGEDKTEEYNGFLDFLVGKTKNTFNKVVDSINENILDPLKEKLGIGEDFKDRTKDSLKNLGTNIMGKIIEANREVYKPAADYLNDKFGISKKVGATKDELYKASPNYKRVYKSGSSSLSKNELRQKFEDKKAKKEKIDTFNENAKSVGGLSYNRINQLNMEGLAGNKSTLIRQADKLGLPVMDLMKTQAVLLGYEKPFKGGEQKAYYTEEELNKVKQLCTDKDGNFDNGKFLIMVSKRYIRNYASTHAKGTIGSIPFAGKTMLSKGEMLFNSKGAYVVDKTDAYNLKEPTHILSSYDSHPILKSMGMNPGVRRTPDQDLKNENRLKNKLFGNGMIANHSGGSTVTTNSGINMDEVKQNLKTYAPEGLAGGIVGGIVSTLFGIVGGPLVGATIGAAGNILANSDSLKEKLFGPLGEDGKRQGGGLISKEIMNGINKYAPDALKYGMAGIIPGMITPLGPLGGILAGAAIGVLKNNKAFTDKYFGEEGKLSVSNHTKKIIQDMMPGAAKGAAVGAVATLFGGPFGLLGNAALGAGVGMMVSTNEFKDLIFGKEKDGKREGGLVGSLKEGLSPLTKLGTEIKDKLFDVIDNEIATPLKKFIEPAVARIPRLATFLPRVLGWAFEKVFHRSFGDIIKDKIATPLANFGSRIINSKIVKGTLHAINPLTYFGMLGDAMRKSDAKHHKADYASGSEIIDFKKRKGMAVNDWDYMRESVEKGQNLDKAKEYLDQLNTLKSSNDKLKSDRNKAKSKVESLITGNISVNGNSVKLSSDTQKALKKIMNSGDADKQEQVARLLSKEKNLISAAGIGGKRSLTHDELNDLLGGKDGLITAIGAYNRADALYNKSKSRSAEDTKKIYDNMYELTGMKVNGRNVDRLISELDSSIRVGNIYKDAKKAPNENVPEELQLKEAQLTNDKLDTLIMLTKEGIDLREASVRGESGLGAALDAQNEIHTGRAENILNRASNKKLSRTISDDTQRLKEAGYNDKQIQRIIRKNPAIRNDMTTATRSRVKVLKTNDLREAITKGVITAEQSKLIKNPAKTVPLLTKLNKNGWILTDNIITYIDKKISNNAVLTTNFKSIYKINKAYSKGRELSEDDVKFAIHNTAQMKFINAKMKRILEAGISLDDIYTLKDVMEYDEGAIHAGLVANDIFNSIGGNDESEGESSSQPVSAATPAVATHGLGTFLLGAAKGIGKGAVSVAKGIGSGVKSLFSNKGGGNAGSALDAASSLINANNNKDQDGTTTEGGMVRDDGTSMKIKKDKDGTPVPDTSDATTKKTLNLIAMKEKAKEKVQQAQLKTSELLHKVFEPTETKKKGINWLGAALMGSVLYKTGILGKIFNGVIKPLWTKCIYPFITDKVVPWIKDTAIPWITDTALPWLSDAITGLTSSVVRGVVRNLPDIFKDVLSGFTDLLDRLTGGGKRKAKHDKKGVKKDAVFYDSKGKKKTKDQLKPGEKYTNDEGEEVTLSDDGESINVNHNDHTYAKKTAYASGRAAFNTLTGVGTNGGIKLADKAANRMLKSKHGLVKIGGAAAKAVTAPVSLATRAATAVKEAGGVGKAIINKRKDRIRNKVLKLAKKGESLVESGAATWKDVDDKFGKKLKKLTGKLDSIDQKALDKASKKSEKAAAKAAKKGQGKLASLLKNISKVIDSLFENNRVLKKVKEAAKFIGVKTGKFAKWVKKLKGKLTKIFTKSAKEGAEKAGEEAVKKGAGAAMKVAGKVFGIAALVGDFVWGMDRAESLLGVSDTTIVEEVVCGLTNALCNLIVIPTVWPGVGKIAEMILEIFGDDLEKRQKEAQKETDEYNAKEGKKLSTEERLANEKSWTGKISHKAKKIWNSAKNKAKDLWNGAKNFFTGKDDDDDKESSSGKGKKKNKYGTGKFGMAKQIDPRIANIRFNAPGDTQYQTIGDSGCGPAAAVTAVQSAYGRSKDPVVGAANLAIRGGYKEKDGGTRPEFFSDYFSRNGLGSNTTSSKSELARSIASGHPTVLMGKDKNGVNTSNPYGKNPHYVTATGVDGRGNVIVQDPESKYNNQIYKMNDVLNKSSFGISTYGTGKYTPIGSGPYLGYAKFGMSKAPKKDTTDYKPQIWAFLTTKAGLTEIAAAGVMGCWQEESSNSPSRVEGDWMPNYPGYTVVMASPEAAEKYTKEILFPHYDTDGPHVNKEAYKCNGHYYPGIGLAGWTGGRYGNLLKFAKENGGDWRKLDTQLNFFLNAPGELKSRRPGLKDDMNNCKTLEESTTLFCKDYEGCTIPSFIQKRIGHAKKIYKKFKGKKLEYDGKTFGSSSSSSDENTTGDASNNSGDNSKESSQQSFVGAISDIISNSKAGKALSLLTGVGLDSSSSSSTSSSSGSDSSDSSSDSDSSSGSASGGDAAKVINIAAKEVGYKEKASNKDLDDKTANAGGNNHTKYNKWYGMDSQPWCAMFSSWVADQAGIPKSVVPKDAYTVTQYNKITKKGEKVEPKNARAGDYIYFTNNGAASGIYHVGIVEDNKDGSIRTIEGNSSNAVSRRTYDKSRYGKILIARPNYADKTEAKATTDESEYSNTQTTDALGGNSNKPLSRYGTYKESIKGNSVRGTSKRPEKIKLIDNHSSQLVEKFEPALVRNYSSTVQDTDKPKYGKGNSNANYSKLIENIVDILMDIADNTDKLNTIVTILNDKLGIDVTKELNNKKANKETKKRRLRSALNSSKQANSDINADSINTIVNNMNALASE